MILFRFPYRRLVRALLLTATIPAAEARAQASGTNALQNASAISGGQRQESGGGSVARVAEFTPEGLQGPPTPAVLYAAAGMNDRQLGQYVAAYRAHMAATWSTRYALMSAVKMLARAGQSSDSDAVLYYQAVAEQLWRELSDSDESFELAVGAILNQSQLQRYREWRAVWQHGAQVQQRLDARTVSGEQDGSG